MITGQPQVVVQNTQQNTNIAQPQPYYPQAPPVYQPPPPQYYPPPAPMMHSSQQSNTTVIIQQPQTVVTTIIPHPPTFLGLSIFSCLCCFWPLGIVAILFSTQVTNRYAAGDYEGAISASLRARNVGYLSIFLGIVTFICIVVAANA